MTGSPRRLPQTILRIPKTSLPGTPSGPFITPSAAPTLCDFEPAVLESIAGLDGAVVIDTDGRLLTFGAILRIAPDTLELVRSVQGARTLAALAASQHGPVLKVSQDGYLTMFLKGRRVWEL